MKVTIIPTAQHGETWFVCHVEEFGLVATGTSRSKRKALRYALEDLAAEVTNEERTIRVAM